MSKNKKIVSLKKLSSIISIFKKEKKKIVMCHGVFDILHIGHIKYFESAKKFGHKLIVTVTKDKFVDKGSHRPAFKIRNRLEALAAIECIDYVSENNWPTSVKTIKFLKPDIYCKGSEYSNFSNDISGQIKNEIRAVKSVGGKIKFTNEATYSSSKIYNSYSDHFTYEQKLFLKKIFKKNNFINIKKIIDNFYNLNALIVGETIIDEYIFSEALGKSGKEPVLVLREIEIDRYLGGSSCIASNLSSFCKKVKLLSMIGENKDHKDFILQKTPKNIKNYFIYKKGSPTIIKKRYVDHINQNKIMGIYQINDELLDGYNKSQFMNKINYLIPKNDIVIVADYGHGLISNYAAKKITKLAKFVAVNAQINASNIGHHSIVKYNNIDCLVINETELRHEMRDKESLLSKLMINLANKNKIKFIIVTQGDAGATLYDSLTNNFYHCPAFATKIIDKIGAGDAMLSIISFCIHQKIDHNLSLYLGSLAAAQSVASIGNSQFVDKNIFLKTIKSSII